MDEVIDPLITLPHRKRATYLREKNVPPAQTICNVASWQSFPKGNIPVMKEDQGVSNTTLFRRGKIRLIMFQLDWGLVWPVQA